MLDLTVEPPHLVVGGSTAHPLVGLPLHWRRRAAIRVFDLAVALPLLIATAPLILLLAIAVRTTSDGPAFFPSHRITRGGRFFTMWKLRTMDPDRVERLAAQFESDPAARALYVERMKLLDDPRVTPLGGFLRRWSLDELPQLLNVARGDMSIVGPRPLLIEEADRLGAVFPAVVRVKGGLTGLWQISGRSDLTFAQRIPLDVRYVNERSLVGDVKILLITAWQFVNGRPGAY